MKNLFLLPTDKPSRLHFDHTGLFLSKKYQLSTDINSIVKGKNIYITSDEEIKEGDWWLNLKTNDVDKCTHKSEVLLYNSEKYEYIKKIILTTDQDLIKDGVQAIDDDFLEWYVKNPSCEFIETKHIIKEYVDEQDAYGYDVDYHTIIIPEEEPKQENKVLVEMQQIPKGESKFMNHYESCDLCHYNAFFKYLYNGEILYRCQGHKIVNINNLKSKFGFGNDESKQETLNLNKLESQLDSALPKETKESLTNWLNIKRNKQETLEETAERLVRLHPDFEVEGFSDYQNGRFNGIIEGIIWLQEQNKNLYNDEEVKKLLISCKDTFSRGDLENYHSDTEVEEWFEKFKKKK